MSARERARMMGMGPGSRFVGDGHGGRGGMLPVLLGIMNWSVE